MSFGTHRNTLEPRLEPFQLDYESASSSDSDDTPTTSPHGQRALHGSSPRPTFLFPPNIPNCSLSSPSSTPIPSRSNSPLPQYYPGHFSSSCPSDDDSEPMTPFLRTSRDVSWRDDRRRRWWQLPPHRRKRDRTFIRFLKRCVRRVVRHPFFPRQPITIVLTLVLLTGLTVCVVLLLMYILNPDKEPLPWRAYCAIPALASPPEEWNGSIHRSALNSSTPYPEFPPPHFDTLPPAGLFIGVFSIDSAFERRSLIRTSWASHARSRNGAVDDDGGDGTSRTVVRFVIGQPKKDYERRIQLEMEMYNDIIVLPIAENMNTGKTHTFFSWASINAWVPPVYTDTNTTVTRRFSYSNYTSAPPILASHDPVHAWRDLDSPEPQSWVRPDYVVKMDDDSFVMLAELEARLRVELHAPEDEDSSSSSQASQFLSWNGSDGLGRRSPPTAWMSSKWADPSGDPLVYWGYLVTNRLHRFMAGELYALSWSLVDWVAKDPTVKGLTRGAEDKQTAQWMRLHPQASRVRWVSERCWIYDHPRSGTVYGHGFLFPSEATRVRQTLSYPSEVPQAAGQAPEAEASAVPSATEGGHNDVYVPTPAAWAHSSVSTFGTRYAPPVVSLLPAHSVEAMVEGSQMSQIREDGTVTAEYAWIHREGRRKRYEEKRVGGTIVVHFIKQNMWYLETALALLEGEEYSEFEKFREQQERKTRPWASHSSSLGLGTGGVSKRNVQLH